MEYLPYQINTFIRCFDKLDDFFNDPTYTHNNPGYYFEENTTNCYNELKRGYFFNEKEKVFILINVRLISLNIL